MFRFLSDRSIQYEPEFKVQRVKERLTDKGSFPIFTEYSADLEIIGEGKAGASPASERGR